MIYLKYMLSHSISQYYTRMSKGNRDRFSKWHVPPIELCVFNVCLLLKLDASIWLISFPAITLVENVCRKTTDSEISSYQAFSQAPWTLLTNIIVRLEKVYMHEKIFPVNIIKIFSIFLVSLYKKLHRYIYISCKLPNCFNHKPCPPF